MPGESIRIVAPDEERANSLVGALDGAHGLVYSEDGAHEVQVVLDTQSAASLTQLFHAVGTWLHNGDDSSCIVHFGDRAFTLLAPQDGKPADATQFLLERTIQLQTALETRVVIEQAKGVLAERLGLDIDEAFRVLRSAARSNGRNLRELAIEVVRSPETPPEVTRLADRRR